MNEPITVTFVEDEAFYLEARHNDPRRNSFWRISVAIISALCVLATWNAYSDYVRGAERWWLPIFMPVIMGPLVMLLYSPVGQDWLLKRKLKKEYLAPFGQGRLEFTSEGFRSFSSQGEDSFHPWRRVHQVVQRPRGFLIFFSKDVYFWVPKRLFENQLVYDRVLAIIANNVKDFKPANP